MSTANYAALFTGESPEPEGAGTGPQAAPYQILLVDDEPNILNALRRVFHQESYQIHTATNSADALKILEQEQCQLLISDFKMPGMNGGELLRHAKKLYPDMIRIMLTGHADADAVAAAVKEGAVYKFILKPWNDDDLRITVALALEQCDLIRRNRELRQQNAQKSKEISALSKLAVTNRSQLAIMLHKRQLLNDKQLQEIYKIQQSKKTPTLQILLDKGWVNEKQIRGILKNDFMIDEVALGEFRIDAAVSSLIPRGFCERQLVIPLRQEKRRLMLAMADPLDMGLIGDLSFKTGLDVQAVMADVADIRDKIAEVYGNISLDLSDLDDLTTAADPYEGIEVIIDDDDSTDIEELLRGTEEPPAIRLVNAIILEAVRHGASDIHIQPRTKNITVRYRIDGVLKEKIQIPLALQMSLVSRIKIMAELDITERRRPQDGRITVKTPMRIVDIRISTLPTLNGEKVVMRILDRNAALYSLDELGFGDTELRKIRNIIRKPQGIILATGPTGSGKTTTLYSMLQAGMTTEKNYVTIEDPIEYYLDAAGQVMIKDKIGLDFATVLRAILRQDPDVILLGEIRDRETAEVAFHAAQTGHFVYSTLHTNSAVATIARLFDLGLKPYVISTALDAIISQRLARKICSHCREPAEAAQETRAMLGPLFQDDGLRSFRGAGCKQCGNSGYSGRIGLYEVLVLDDTFRNLIATGASIGELTSAAAQSETTTIIQDARRKADAGLTTLEEILRVLGPQVL